MGKEIKKKKVNSKVTIKMSANVMKNHTMNLNPLVGP